MADSEEVYRLEDEVCNLKAKADRCEEELQRVKESLSAVMVEWDEASLRVDSLSKSPEDEWSESQALKDPIGSIFQSLVSLFGSVFFLSHFLTSLSSFQASRRIWRSRPRPLGPCPEPWSRRELS